MKNEELARRVIDKYVDELADVPASRNHHASFDGGLLVHLETTFAVAKKYFPQNEKLKFLALVHDIGKARVYSKQNDEWVHKKPDVDHILHTIIMLKDAGVELDDETLNALQFHHGGWSNFKGSGGRLAIKLHFCDMMACRMEEKRMKNEREVL